MTFARNRILGLAALLFITACGEDQARSSRTEKTVPGSPAQSGTARQEKSPLTSFRTTINGFHFQSGDLSKQVEEYSFCSKLSDEASQCVLFDGTGETAHLTGIEYIVSRRMFDSFSRGERRLWHSHAYGVKSGLFVSPGLSDRSEHSLMSQFISTYGKIWHTWHSQQGEQLPIGPPLLMSSFTAQGQLKPEMLTFRDERLQTSAADKSRAREDIPNPEISPDADAWSRGEGMQVQMVPLRTTKK